MTDLNRRLTSLVAYSAALGTAALERALAPKQKPLAGSTRELRRRRKRERQNRRRGRS